MQIIEQIFYQLNYMNFYCGNSWDNFIKEESKKDYFGKMINFVEDEYANNIVYPPHNCIFNAFNRVAPEKIKVVILGQDPYHEKGQANGFAFAVNEGVKAPPSLKNIFKEVEAEFGKCPESFGLENWARQGVLMLNTVLTVREGQPQSHSKCGWQIFTDNAIKFIGNTQKNVVYMLWGANAWNKENIIPENNLVLKSVHPSPLSAYRGFFGCGHFKTANKYIEENGKTPIDWCK